MNGNRCGGAVRARRRKLRSRRGAASPVPAEGPRAARRLWLAAPWEPAGPRLEPEAVLADPSLCPQSQDAGTYTCTAENPVGRARRRVHLTILALPVFTTLPGDRSLRPGDRLWLRCAARGSPTPRIGWTVNDRPVTGLGHLRAGGQHGTLGGCGGPAGGAHAGREVEGVSRCCGSWVSRRGPGQPGWGKPVFGHR